MQMLTDENHIRNFICNEVRSITPTNAVDAADEVMIAETMMTGHASADTKNIQIQLRYDYGRLL